MCWKRQPDLPVGSEERHQIGCVIEHGRGQSSRRQEDVCEGDRKTLVMSTAANRECVTVGEGERDFWEGVRLKKGEKWREFR
jgi:hypothetical protein